MNHLSKLQNTLNMEENHGKKSFDERVSSFNRFKSALPQIQQKVDGQLIGSFGDHLDRKILKTAIPSMINLAVVPLVNGVDTFWVGRLGSALALAGQAAANQAFFTLYFLVAFVPTITAPLVAAAVGGKTVGEDDKADKYKDARDRVCESLFLSNILGGIGMLLLVGFPKVVLRLILDSQAPAMDFAVPYLRIRAWGMIPALFAATGFAAYRGLLDTVTPLKVSLGTNAFNLLADPILMFGALGTRGLGMGGAALATAFAETASGLVYLKLLLQKGLVRWSQLLKPPKDWTSIIQLLKGGMAMLARQATLNVAFITAARRAQAMDPSGVSAAAYGKSLRHLCFICFIFLHSSGPHQKSNFLHLSTCTSLGIVMQIYSVGIVVHLGIQSTAAALVPAARAADGDDAARSVADRTFLWGSIVGILLGVTQIVALPYLVPLFSTLPEVQQAIRAPGLIAAIIHMINGPVFAGEGCMLGLGTFRALATVTAIGVTSMVACLMTPMGRSLDGILVSLAVFCSFQAIGVITHHLRFGPLRRRDWKGRLWPKQ
jgi:Na+-driven multidrug efflux pump